MKFLRHLNTVKRSKAAFAIVASVAVLCGCATAQVRPLRDGKVLLNVSSQEKERLLTRLGFTNWVTSGAACRDSTGTRLFVSVEPGPRTHVQNERTQQLVIVTARGAQIQPWHFPANERVTDDGKVAVWQDSTQGGRWEVRSGEWLPKDCWVDDVSGDWIAVGASGRDPWVARLDTPTKIAATLPDSPGLVAIYATGQVVHVFTRRGWRNDEGPMRYLLYDFAQGSKPVRDMVMPSWARITLDMDPATGLVVINDNNRFWGRSWLFDLNTGKRKWVATPGWPTLIVDKNVAKEWVVLTKP
jgi:hypothetical protein